jgi:hypothetical protein
MNENPSLPGPDQPPKPAPGVPAASPPPIPQTPPTDFLRNWKGYEPPPSRHEPALGEEAGDTIAVGGPLGVIDALLRHPRRVVYRLRQAAPEPVVCMLLVAAAAMIAVYGAVVGSFSGGPQWWAAPAKVVAGFSITAAICLPSLYIFSCLGGSNARLAEVAGVLAGALALSTLLLIGFAPVAWIFSQSTESIAMMGFLHLLFWLVAVRFGLRFLLSSFRHFGLKSEVGLQTWIVIFLLVSLQMTAALRPLVGPATPDHFLPKEKKFFVQHWLDSIDDSSARAPSR